jgi:hypothetical protein
VIQIGDDFYEVVPYPCEGHTDADLAMALELVPHLELDWHLSGKTNGNKDVTAWLLWEVRNALLERAS